MIDDFRVASYLVKLKNMFKCQNVLFILKVKILNEKINFKRSNIFYYTVKNFKTLRENKKSYSFTVNFY